MFPTKVFISFCSEFNRLTRFSSNKTGLKLDSISRPDINLLLFDKSILYTKSVNLLFESFEPLYSANDSCRDLLYSTYNFLAIKDQIINIIINEYEKCIKVKNSNNPNTASIKPAERAAISLMVPSTYA